MIPVSLGIMNHRKNDDDESEHSERIGITNRSARQGAVPPSLYRSVLRAFPGDQITQLLTFRDTEEFPLMIEKESWLME